MADFFKESFIVNKINKKEKLVNQAVLFSDNYKIEVDYHNEYFTPILNNSINLIFYHRSNDDSIVPSEYDYLVQGIIYKIKNEDEFIYEISFGGLLMKIASNDMLFNNVETGDTLMVGFSN